MTHFTFDSSRQRITSKQVGALLKCLIRDDQPKNLTMDYKRGVLGEKQHQMIEVLANGYYFLFMSHMHELGGCVACLTPAYKEWTWQHDGGEEPMNFLDPSDKQSLKALLMDEDTKLKITVEPCWQVMTGAGTPMARRVTPMSDWGPAGDVGWPTELSNMGLFRDKEKAEIAAEKFRKYLAAHQKKISHKKSKHK